MNLEIPQSFVDRFAEFGFKINSPVTVRFWLHVPKNGPPRASALSFVKPEELVHTTPDYIDLTYIIACHDMSIFRRWEYIVADGNLRWLNSRDVDNPHGMPPSGDEEALAMELLRAVI